MINFSTLIKEILASNPQTYEEVLVRLRDRVKESSQPIPTKTDVLKAYRDLIEKKEIEPHAMLEKLLRRRQIRTLSGVAPITVMTAPLSCPSDCIYCPTEAKMPKSYLSNQPAAMRAVLSKFDPFTQVTARLDALYNNGHSPEKIEIIVNGGTWAAHPIRYKTWFIKRIFDACNQFKPGTYTHEDQKAADKSERTNLIAKRLRDFNFNWFRENNLGGIEDSALMVELAAAQIINETGRWRIIGLTLETRPDYINLKELSHMRQLGCTKVELGVQTLYDDVQLLNQRGHDTQAVVRATKLLREAGFKIAYHMMPNLYGSTPERDVAMFHDLFEGPRFQPDHLKLYPCLVVKEAKLHKIFEAGLYKPYSDEVMFETLLKCKLAVAPYCRISRLMRDIPSTSIDAGVRVTNIREDLHRELARRGLHCRCIRCREARNETVDLAQAVLTRREYDAGDGREIFLSYESPDQRKIYAFVRLRLPQYVLNTAAVPADENVLSVLPELTGCAHIRELHTYGKLVPIASGAVGAVQHMGFGKKLMLEAEKIASEAGAPRMAVIAGVGVREYYKKLGYELKGTYMIKDLG